MPDHGGAWHAGRLACHVRQRGLVPRADRTDAFTRAERHEGGPEHAALVLVHHADMGKAEALAQGLAALRSVQNYGAVADFIQDAGNQLMANALALLFRRDDQHPYRGIFAAVDPTHRRSDHAAIVFGDDAHAEFLDELPILQPMWPQHRKRQLMYRRNILRCHSPVSNVLTRFAIFHALLLYAWPASTARLAWVLHFCMVPFERYVATRRCAFR